MSDKKILYIIGDSISMHYGPYLDRIISSGDTFKGILRISPENTSSSDKVIELLITDGRNFQDQIILWNAGLHDVRRNREDKLIYTPLPEYGANLRKIQMILKNKGFRQIFINSTPVYDDRHNNRASGWIRLDSDIKTYNEEAQKIMTELKVPIIDLYSFTKTFGENALFDHVHFKPEIRLEQAKYIATCIDRILAKDDFIK